MSSGWEGRRMALGGRLFKRLSLAFVSAVLLGAASALSPGQARGQAPDEDWRTITTPHFRVTFPARLEALGRKAADRAEWAWDELSEHFVEPPDGIIDVLVTDHADVSNGFAQVTPSNRITVFARPPADVLSLGHLDEWMELVITHELAHIVHLDYVKNPIGRLSRAVFGRVSAEWPFFPELGTPRWVIEGLATWYESRLTHAGRVKGTFEEMQIRTAVLEGRFESIGQASGDSPLWPGGNRRYAYGSLFFDFLLERHGEESMGAFADAIAGQWVPYRIDAAGRNAFGVSLSDEWRAWESELESDLSGLDVELGRFAPITEPERLTHDARWGLHPVVSPDGHWLVYTRADGRSDTQLRIRDTESGASRKLGRTQGLSTFSWMPDGRLLVAQLELEGPYRTYGDLYVFQTSGGEHRLTRAARLGQPSVSPDGSYAVAVQQGDGTNALVHVDLASGAVSDFVAPDPEVHWAFPRLSPDGRWIAVTRWEPNAYHDVVIVDASTGDVVHEVTRDRAIDLAPSWSADGRWIVWASDRSGILNILGAEVDSATGVAAEPRAMTNVRTGAAYPSIDPTGEWLYFSGYHVDGWEIERVPFNPEGRPVAAAAVARFDFEGDAPARGTSSAPIEDYEPGLTLSPTYWEIEYRAPVVTPEVTILNNAGQDSVYLRPREVLGPALGARTTGRDLVGRHAYAASARVFTSGGEVEGGFSYAFLGFANPVLSIALTQGYQSAGQLVTGADVDTLFIVERARAIEGALSFRAPTWKRSVAFTLSGGMVWEHDELLANNLEPSRLYSLPRPSRRVADVAVSASYNSSRTHSFQMGTTRGINVFVQGRLRSHLSLADSLAGVAGVDRSVGDVIGRVRGAIPLWGGGRATHVFALRASGGVASGPGASAGQYRVGGASGRSEPITGATLFGGRFVFYPVRGFDTSRRFGRYAWSASAEYRFPLWLVNRGLGAWPLHFDRAVGSIFFDTGNAWGAPPTTTGSQNLRRAALASFGAEITTEVLALYNVEVRLRTGLAVPLVEGGGVRMYLRFGLPF